MAIVREVTVGASLSGDVLMEILKRLPVKSILRCRCVQKYWCSLIQSPYFIALHSPYQSTSDKYLLFYYSRQKMFSLRFDDKQFKEYVAFQFSQDMRKKLYLKGELIYETSNGLICVSATLTNKVYLWNPVIRKFKSLPDSPLPSYRPKFCSFHTSGVAFGYFAKSNEYKVIKLERYSTGYGKPVPFFLYIHVYSLSTNSWKTIKEDKFGEFPSYQLSHSVVVHGAAYWVGNKLGFGMPDNIVCFDMEKETIREISLPPSYSVSINNNNIVASVENFIFGELLSLFCYDRLTNTIHIWVLEDEGGTQQTWKKKTSLELKGCPMGFRDSGELILVHDHKFWSYDLEKKEAKEIVDCDSLGLDASYRYEIIRSPFPRQVLIRFEESLVLLNDNAELKIQKQST